MMTSSYLVLSSRYGVSGDHAIAHRANAAARPTSLVPAVGQDQSQFVSYQNQPPPLAANAGNAEAPTQAASSSLPAAAGHPPATNTVRGRNTEKTLLLSSDEDAQ